MGIVLCDIILFWSHQFALPTHIVCFPFLCYICLVTAEVGLYDNQINELGDEGKQYNSLI